MKTICLIPARGGSTRVPRKNIRMFHGKPIIAYSIENAQKCGLFDSVIVSTDDHEIDHIARKYGASVTRRPQDDGTKGTQELAGEYLKTRPDVGICCVLYATAPLLTWRDLLNGWRWLCYSDDHFYAYSIATAAPMQDIGGYYWGFAQAFRDGIPLSGNSIGNEISPERCCDINTEDDFSRAERMYEALKEGR